jgi:hypothetical protein
MLYKNNLYAKEMEQSQTIPETPSSVSIPGPVSKSLSVTISRLHVMVEVAERYKPLFTQLLNIFQDMYEARDKRLIFDIQPLAAYIRPEKSEGFKTLINELRNHLNISVKSSNECKKRLVQLRTKLTKNEEFNIIDEALELLNLPSSAEIQSDADFKLLTLQQSVTDVDSAIEIQEIFIFLNHMFQPIDESNSKPSNKSQNKRK